MLQRQQALSEVLHDSSVREAAEKVSACFGDDLDACLQFSLDFLHKRYSRRYPTKIRLVEAALLLLEKVKAWWLKVCSGSKRKKRLVFSKVE